MLENMQIIIPEFILDKESHHRAHCAEETAGIGDSVQRQIGDNVSPFVVLTHLIAGGREERQQNLILWMLTAKLLHQRAALFELTQRSSMEPHVLRLWIHLLSQDAESLSLALPHLAHLLVEATINRHTQEVEIYDDVIHLN